VRFFLDALQIVLIDLVLAGDNALVIAMAVRSLSGRQRRLGILFGASAAVALRVGLTMVASQLLGVPYLQLVGGLLVLWIAVKVLGDTSHEHAETPQANRFTQAIWYIVVADVTMSIDNVLAIAGAAKGHFGLILFGLAVSIPFVVVSSNLLARLMDRYGWLIYIGAGILGKVGGDMIVTDPFIQRTLNPGPVMHYGLDAALVALVLLIGRLRAPRK
jgi:YjbE family integral membrane protein